MAEIARDALVLADVEDFLAWLAGQEDHYEFIDGRIVGMAGGSERHNDIQVNLTLAIGTRLDRLTGHAMALRYPTAAGGLPAPPCARDITSGLADLTTLVDTIETWAGQC